MKALYIIKKPIVTEKALKMGEKMTYVFYVDKKATKIDVKIALRETYGHPVATVRMINTPLKTKAFGKKVVNKRPEMRKAIVTFKGKKKIDVAKIAKTDAKKS